MDTVAFLRKKTEIEEEKKKEWIDLLKKMPERKQKAGEELSEEEQIRIASRKISQELLLKE